jgi:long-chain acyl-CoA synthetase
MCPLIDVPEVIAQAHQMGGPPFLLPWGSFADFLRSRVNDPALSERTFLTYYDDDRSVHRAYTYAEFGDKVFQMATFMRDRLGLKRGDRIATVLFNHDQTVFVYFAAWTLGIAVVPINVEESTEKKRYILEHSEASTVFCWQDYVDEVRSLRTELPNLREVIAVGDHEIDGRFFSPSSVSHIEESRGDLLSHAEGEGTSMGTSADSLHDIALIVYTSGTTGSPKGVILTAEHLLVDSDGIADWHGFGSHDRLMCVLPIHHVNGTVATMVTPFYCKGAAVLNRKFKASTFWERLHQEGVTCVSVVPTLLEFLLEANEDVARHQLDRFGGFICGAGPLLKDTAVRFEERFKFPIRHGYGLSETTCYSCFLPNDLSPDQHRRWLVDYEFPSIGIPLRHNEMAILDDQGRPLPELARGEICIRGRTVCDGYFKRPDANEAAFRRPFFFISGRLKELIIRGGVNISPLEIDDVLKGHPAVNFGMAVPFENRYYGEEIAAYIVPKNPAAPPAEADVLAFCRSHLPFAKRPKVILFGTDVPYTATGKPKRLELKARLAPELASYRDIQFKEQSERKS